LVYARGVRLALLAPLLLAATACGSDRAAGGPHRLEVAAAFFPLEQIATAVGGDLVDVVTLVPPGQEAHEYEPTPKQMAGIEHADVLLYLKGFESGVDDAAAALPGSVHEVDVSAGLRKGDDPHVWLDPQLMKAMTTRVADALSTAEPASATAFHAAATAYAGRLDALDATIHAGLATCAAPYLVTSHDAFGYFSRRYGLTVVPIAGISPEAEPTAKQLEKVAAAAKAHHVSTVYFEDNLPADLASTVAGEIGVATASLDSLESPSKDQLRAGETYVSAMTANLAAIRGGLQCT
jgi:zinc transport system substrate-binding protein